MLSVLLCLPAPLKSLTLVLYKLDYYFFIIIKQEHNEINKVLHEYRLQTTRRLTMPSCISYHRCRANVTKC